MGVPVKKAWPSWFQIRERKGTGSQVLTKLKKAERLQVYLLSLDNVPTHVPCLVYGHVYAGVYACPGLFLPSWGDIKKRGRGRIGSISEKRPQNINAWNWVGVSMQLMGKTDQGSWR